MLVLTLSYYCRAEDQSLDFDPFAAEVEASISNQSTFGPVIPQVDFSNNDISMAFQIISDATGWSIFPTTNVSKAKINLWAKNISAQQLFDTVITMAGFVYHRKDNIITVMTYDEYMQYYGLAKQIFKLDFAKADSVNAAIKPFLTKLGKSVVHEQTNTIVLYEAQANLTFIESVIEKLDTPAENIIIEVINLKYSDSETISKILQSVFNNQKKNPRNKSTAQNAEVSNATAMNMPGDSIEIHANITANQLVIVGTIADIEKVRSLIAMIDVYGNNMAMEVIDLKYADSELLAESLRELFTDKKKQDQPSGITESRDSKTAAPLPQGLLSPRSQVFIQALGRTNQLLIKAYRADIERLKQLIEKLDSYVEPITQYYHLTYIDAAEIYSGLERILSLDSRNNRKTAGPNKSQGLTLIEKTNSILLTGPPSAHRIMTSIVDKIDRPNTYETGMIRIYKLENADVDEVAAVINDLIGTDPAEETDSNVNFSQKNTSASQTNSADSFAQSEEYVPQIEARVSVSLSTNSIIVQATARQHRELEKLIRELDTRRKQVLITAMIVEVTTTDDLNFGIEVAQVAGSFIGFTSFGLSTIDGATGAKEIIVSPGGTAAVLDPDTINALVQAIKSDSNAKITSSPQILINDNAVGYIESVSEEPYTQINQGQTTSTTSFGGFVEAGTQFALTPHISEKDYLRIEYQITLNSFLSTISLPSSPPPRRTTSIKSEATVPNCYTIVVGGLQTSDEEEFIEKIPFLGDIPIIGEAFKNTEIEKEYKTTYLFITPTIMDCEDFSDLKTVSNQALSEIEDKTDENEEECVEVEPQTVDEL